MIKKALFKLLSSSLFMGLLSVSCSHNTQPISSATGSSNRTTGVSSPACIIYRTRSDYSMNVPVTLSADKNMIGSYPDIKDIYFDGRLSVPTHLSDGFLLDNRGIGLEVGFLSYTYDEYSKLPKTPSAGELMKTLLDKDPLTEMYQCGRRSQYTEIEKELNALITSGRLSTCKKLK